MTSTGNITLNSSVIDFGGGSNRFEIDRGVITLTGGDSLVTGADVFMTLATIDARNGVAGSTLTLRPQPLRQLHLRCRPCQWR